ncbi:unnamed protein product, partial [Nesidiocoris tenuis]
MLAQFFERPDVNCYKTKTDATFLPSVRFPRITYGDGGTVLADSASAQEHKQL